MIRNKLSKLKKLLNSYNIDGYIVPKNDAYFSEFASPDRLKIISNFSGSAGHAIILKKKNYLFVDGRYTIQAELESGKEYKILEIPKFSYNKVFNIYKKKLNLGFDPQLFTNFYIKNKLNKYFSLLPINDNLIDTIQKRSKNKSVTPFYNLNSKITGEKINSKINKITNELKKFKIDNIFISAPENVAWLLNLRGKDSPNAPIPNSKIFLTKNKKIYFFSCPKKIWKMKKIKDYKNVTYCKYNSFLSVLKNLKGNSFCIDGTTCSISNENNIKSLFKIKSTTDPCYRFKSIKNKIEIQHMIKAHVEDGLALTRFIYWIKKKNNKKITEFDAQNKLERLRKNNKNYLYPSFNTIAGTGSNAAIVHYRSKKNNTKIIQKKIFFYVTQVANTSTELQMLLVHYVFQNQKKILKIFLQEC